MIGNDREADIAGARIAGLSTLYMHTNLTPAQQAEAEPALHPLHCMGSHCEFEGWDWHVIAKILCEL